METIFTKIKFYPKVRTDLSEIENLLFVIDNLRKESAIEGVYVLASSQVINDDLLRNACMFYFEYDRDLCDSILRVSHIDTRDEFPEHFFQADLVLVAEPTQYHLEPIDQEVIGIPAHLIKRGYFRGVIYQKLPYEFKLEEEVNVYLYEKVGDDDEGKIQSKVTFSSLTGKQ